MNSSNIQTLTDPELRRGQIQVIFGPMFSGKTTELLRRIRRYQLAKQHCVLVKYAKDCRYDENGVSTHDKQVLPALSALALSEVKGQVEAYDVIGIDEGQFFPDIVEFADKMAEGGKIVIVAALDGTFQRKGFGEILNLVPIAESVIKLTAVCMGCFREASYTKRKGKETRVEVIGGADKYEASCRNCLTSPAKRRQPCSEDDKENRPSVDESIPSSTKEAVVSPLTSNRLSCLR